MQRALSTREPALVIALGLVVLAIVLVVVEPWHGSILFTVMPDHGVDTGDLIIVPLVVLAGWLARSVWLDRAASGQRTTALPVGSSAIAFGLALIATGGIRLWSWGGRTGWLPRLLAVLLVGSAIWFVVDLLLHHSLFVEQRGRWWVAGLVLLAGCLLDVVFVPSGTLFGVALLALYHAWATSNRVAAAVLVSIAVVSLLLNVASLADIAGIDVTMSNDGGGAARNVALGTVLLCVGVTSLVGARRHREVHA